jgi:hypothetical protein
MRPAHHHHCHPAQRSICAPTTAVQPPLQQRQIPAAPLPCSPAPLTPPPPPPIPTHPPAQPRRSLLLYHVAPAPLDNAQLGAQLSLSTLLPGAELQVLDEAGSAVLDEAGYSAGLPGSVLLPACGTRLYPIEQVRGQERGAGRG